MTTGQAGKAVSSGDTIATTKQPVLITGGTGKTGSRIVQQLQQLGWPLRVGSRSGKPAFDWLDTRTWKPALDGMEAAYISFQPDLAVPGAVDAIRYFTETAAAAGLRKLVLLSGRGEREAQDCEAVVMESGMDWTILRASWFLQNFSEGFFLEPLQAGHLVVPAVVAREPFTDIGDIADMAVAALTTDTHKGQLYEITGPQLLGFKEVVSAISRAAGRNIAYEEVPLSEYAAMLACYGVPVDHIRLITYLFGEVLDGRNESLADGVQRALGRAPGAWKHMCSVLLLQEYGLSKMVIIT
jgi:uncharacterized protein YbjT (DUF2867 family)